jgi:hypothetical protein
MRGGKYTAAFRKSGEVCALESTKEQTTPRLLVMS